MVAQLAFTSSQSHADQILRQRGQTIHPHYTSTPLPSPTEVYRSSPCSFLTHSTHSTLPHPTRRRSSSNSLPVKGCPNPIIMKIVACIIAVVSILSVAVAAPHPIDNNAVAPTESAPASVSVHSPTSLRMFTSSRTPQKAEPTSPPTSVPSPAAWTANARSARPWSNALPWDARFSLRHRSL